jgi:hypothetical protein
MADLPPLGPPSILTPPAGWLGYLGIKNGGRQPDKVNRDLACVLDMSVFYRAGLRTKLFGPGAGLAAVQNGLTTLATVPAGKVWVIEHASAVSTAGLGATANVIAYITINDSSAGAGDVLVSPPSFGGQRALTGEKLFVSLDCGAFVATPGTTINVFTVGAAAPTAFSYFGFVFGLEVLA